MYGYRIISTWLVAAFFMVTQDLRAQYDHFGELLKDKAVSLDSSSLANGSPFAELQSVIDPDFKVIGIGEQSHGTSEFFNARISLIKSLVAGGALNKIGLEAPMAEVEKLNAYISEGQGDLKAILASFRLYNYECKEFVGLVENVKKLNQSTRTKLRFFGFDMQSPFQSLQNVLESCLTNDGSAADSLKKLVQYYRTLNNDMYNHSVSREDFSALKKLGDHIFGKLERNKAVCLKTDLIRQSIINYRQFLTLNDPELSYDIQANLRDSLMAENIFSELKPDDKIIILAHNGHVQRTPNMYSKSMGFFLSQRLGAKYQCIALTTSSGFYTAFTPEAGRVTDKNPIPVADTETFEYQFSKMGKPVFFLKTSNLLQKVGTQKVPVKYKLLPFGLTNKPFTTGNLLKDFDYVLHIERTTGNQSFYLK